MFFSQHVQLWTVLTLMNVCQIHVPIIQLVTALFLLTCNCDEGYKRMELAVQVNKELLYCKL